MEKAQALTRKLVGRVVSNKMQKTVTVLVSRKVAHPLYGKLITRSKKYHVHHDGSVLQVGDLVEIAEGKRISKTKSWTVVSVVESAAE